MINKLKKSARRAIPRPLINSYHYARAQAATIKYGQPSKKMVIIGVTGSKGKSTVSNMIWAILSASGAKVGQTGTANFRIGDREYLNPYHMTMPKPAILQDWLTRMKQAGCHYAVIETPSEAQVQYRHIGITYDVLVQTNITDEYVEAHKYSLDRLIRDNARVYARLNRSRHKMVKGVPVKKTIISGIDDERGAYYGAFAADYKLTYGINANADIRADNIHSTPKGTTFDCDGVTYKLKIIGQVNAINALAAIAVARHFKISPQTIQKGFDKLEIVPGRMERIDEGQDFTVFVDYAHEQTGLKALLQTARQIVAKKNRVIVLTGGQGGGRDTAKRPVMGQIAAAGADYVIITNEDPFDEDPEQIIDEIAVGAKKAGKIKDKDLFCLSDRKAGITKALSLAKSGDIVLITGKGSEQSLIEGGRKIPWDDRKVVRKLLAQEKKRATKK